MLAGVSVLPFLAFGASAQVSERDEIKRETPIEVTGRTFGEADEALPVTVLTGEEFVTRRMGTLGETLEALPGVHLDNFGGGASKPVIRGQTVPRIAILSDGAPVFDASGASPDHAVVTDPLLLDGIEVLRGPAASIYGGNAMNGAVNLIDSKVPKALPENGMDGAVEARYSTADNGYATAGRATFGAGSFAFHVEGSLGNANDYDVPNDYGSDKLKDSFAENANYSVGGSWITEKGYVGVAYTVQEAEYGLPGHSHANGVCHLHGYPSPAPGRIDLHCRGHGNYQNPLTNPDSDTALIDLRSERVDIRADYDDLLPGFSHVRLRGSYTDYMHDEVDGPILYSRYSNEVWDGRVELTHQPVLGLTGTLGVQYTDGTFSGLNLIDLHVPSTDTFGFEGVQEYVTENIGIFLNERRRFGNVDIDIAARKDWRTIRVPIPGPFYANVSDRLNDIYINLLGPDWLENEEANRIKSFQERNPDRKHNPFSASIGATWNVTDAYSVALSLAHTERAPNVRELFANGSSLATNSYEVGLLASSNFVANYLPDDLFDYEDDVVERAHAVNLTFRKTEGSLNFEIGTFYQDVENYIFAHLLETEYTTGQRHDFLLYTAADAEFYGVDGQMSYQLDPASRVTVFGDYVATNLKEEDDNLPRISPGRLGVRYHWANGPLSADVEFYRTFAQNDVASYETETNGYNMLNATVSYEFVVAPDRTVDVFLRGTNLTNELAYVHTSFVKDQSPLRGTNFVMGVRHAF